MKMTLDKNILVPMGRRIKQLREDAHFSREQFADNLGVSTESVKAIELGKSMSLSTFYMICEVLDTSADYILFGKLTGPSNPMTTLLENQTNSVAQGAYDIVRTYIDTVNRAKT